MVAINEIVRRPARGERVATAKLTAKKVREIRGLRKEGAAVRRLAVVFGVTPAAIRAVLSGRTWAHVTR